MNMRNCPFKKEKIDMFGTKFIECEKTTYECYNCSDSETREFINRLLTKDDKCLMAEAAGMEIDDINRIFGR